MTFFFNWLLIQISFTTITGVTYSCWSNSTCGCSSNSVVLTRIIGGEEAQINTWGWAVSIRLKNMHICGGSLIASDLVLTAAHCLVSIQTIPSLSITAGSKYLSIIDQQRSVSEIFIHRNYNSSTYVNDIAVIRVSSPFNMNDNSLALVCLPSNVTENTSVVAIGWGVLSTADKTSSNTLQQVSLVIIANTDEICQRSIHNVNVQLCAGIQGGGKDTCQGDSGSPLMIFSNNQWYLIGITSYGISCALPDYAGVYTKVETYQKSILCFLNNDTLCIKENFLIRNSGSSVIVSFYMNSIGLFIAIIYSIL